MAFKLFDRLNKPSNIHTVAFYNLENLFDTKDDKHTLDDDFLPQGKNKWNQKRYERKLYKLGTAISNIGFEKAGKAPAIVGVAEVENKQVLKDLVQTKHLKNKKYGVVHYDSPDERVIDVGLIYRKEYFEVVDSRVYPLLLGRL